jgi:hypothetical protein
LEKKNKKDLQTLNEHSSSEEESKSLKIDQQKIVVGGGGLTRVKAVLNLEEEKKREELDIQLPDHGDSENVKKEGFTVSDHKHS